MNAALLCGKGDGERSPSLDNGRKSCSAALGISSDENNKDECNPPKRIRKLTE